MGHHPDPQDFNQAIVAAYPRLFRFARRLTRNDVDASDLVQDAMARALSRRDRFQDGTAADRWLSTILRRMFVDRCRHAQVERRAGHQVQVLEELTRGGGEREDSANCRIEPWELFTIDDVRRASRLLSPALRRPYQLFAFEGRSYEEIAALLAIPALTVATRMSRARARLRRLLVAVALGSQAARNDNHDPHPPAAAVGVCRAAIAVPMAAAR